VARGFVQPGFDEIAPSRRSPRPRRRDLTETSLLSRINSVDDSGPAGRDAVASGCDEPEPIPRQFAPLGGVDLDRTHRKLRPAALLQAVIVADTNVRS
jgi:hypothetical protein